MAGEVGAPVGTESSLSNWAAPYVTDMLGKGWGLSEVPYTPYEGPLTAGASGLQQQAFSGIAGLAVPGSMSSAANAVGAVGDKMGATSYNPTQFTSGYQAPSPYTAGTFDAGTWDSGIASQYMNPYLQNALEPQLAEARRQAEITRIGDAGRLTQAGAYGGSRQAIMESELNRNLLRNLSDITGTGYNAAYDRAMSAYQSDAARNLQAQQYGEQSRQFGYGQGMSAADTAARYDLEGQRATEQSRQFGSSQALDALRSELAARQSQAALGQQELQGQRDIFADQLRAGELQRDIESQGIAADMRQFEQERDYPYKMTQFMQSLLQGMPIAAQNTSYVEPSTFQNAMGGASGIVSLLQELGLVGGND